MMSKAFNLFILSCIKILSRIFFKVETKWLHHHEGDPWQGIRLICFLNHTSLWEPLFIGGMPWRAIFRAAGKLFIPAADITLNRPIVGSIFKIINPSIFPITRKRDQTWDDFLNKIKEDHIVAILPEGRMKRANGLDKFGRPMSVRGGIADVLKKIGNGTMLIVYSQGLHHVQIPGQFFPHLGKTIEVKLERVDISSYIKKIQSQIDFENDFKELVKRDLTSRIEKYTPIS